MSKCTALILLRAMAKLHGEGHGSIILYQGKSEEWKTAIQSTTVTFEKIEEKLRTVQVKMPHSIRPK